MTTAANELVDGFRELDSAIVFNAINEILGGWTPASGTQALANQPDYYTGPQMRCMIPELGCAVGYALTAELTTNDPDSQGIPWDDYYQAIEDSEVPVMAVIKDVDSRPGRGACFATAWRRGTSPWGPPAPWWRAPYATWLASGVSISRSGAPGRSQGTASSPCYG